MPKRTLSRSVVPHNRASRFHCKEDRSPCMAIGCGLPSDLEQHTDPRGNVSKPLRKGRLVAASRVTLLAGVAPSVRRGCKFVRIPSVSTIWRVGVRNIALSGRKYLAALLTATLSLAVHDPINRGRSIRMRDCIGLHDIEMLAEGILKGLLGNLDWQKWQSHWVWKPR